MKSERSFLSHSAQGIRRRIPGSGLVESKCPACGQNVNGIADPSPEQDQNLVAFPSPVDWKHLSNATELKKVLHFSQQLYAHALTLQELIRNEGEIRYEVLRPRYDRQAAQQFEVFYRALGRLTEFRTPAAGACE